MFLIIAVVGWRSSNKVKNINDFTLAGSGLGKIQAGFSMAAREFGGSSLIGAIAAQAPAAQGWALPLQRRFQRSLWLEQWRLTEFSASLKQ